MEKNQANVTEAGMCDVVREANMVEDDPKEFWYDTYAITHVCAKRFSVPIKSVN